jgi:anti-anti-sigma factor
LVEGGAAEEFERRIQVLLAEGYHDLVIDLSDVDRIDDAGIRGLVRGHTTAHRLGGSLRLTGLNDQVRAFLRATRLDAVFTMFDSLEAAQERPWPWRAVAVGMGGVALCVALVWAGLTWPVATSGADGIDAGLQTAELPRRPFLEFLKLIAAASIGLLVTVVHRPSSPHDRPLSRSMEQAQILLCVSGAMMMIIIGNSLARAFGIAGAASIIRFRTPVEDPKDVTILFLLMALGMACGLGTFAVAGLGTIFLCLFLLLLDGLANQKARSMRAELVAEGRDFPVGHVQGVFARHGVLFEPREISQGDEATVEYHATLRPETSLEDLSSDLMAGGTSGLKSVSWGPAKRAAP